VPNELGFTEPTKDQYMLVEQTNVAVKDAADAVASTKSAGVSFSKGIEDAWTKIATFAPKLIGFLAILIIGLFIAKVIRKVLARILAAAKVDPLLDRTGVGASLKKSGVGSASSLITRIAYLGLVLMVLQIALGALGPNPISTVLTSMMSYIPKIIVAIVIILFTGFIAEKVGELLRSVMNGRSYGPLITKLAVAGIWMIGGFAALDQIQVAKQVVDTLFRTVVTSLGAILVIGRHVIASGRVCTMR
jgi:flagellar biosynthesis protein FliQ